jgi:hypothetical protein
MKITLKDFLKEQASKGIEVPKIFEEADSYNEPVKDKESENDEDEEGKENSAELSEKLIELANALKNGTSVEISEGFFDKLKNAFAGAIEFNVANPYTGSPEAQTFVAKDPRAKKQLEILTKKGLTPEEANAAVMYVFDKSGKAPHGFMNKSVDFDPQSKKLVIGANNAKLSGATSMAR